MNFTNLDKPADHINFIATHGQDNWESGIRHSIYYLTGVVLGEKKHPNAINAIKAKLKDIDKNPATKEGRVANSLESGIELMMPKKKP